MRRWKTTTRWSTRLIVCAVLIRDIHQDPVKRAVVAGMLGVASQIGGRVIAEGVETNDVRQVLGDLGVELAQGYYLLVAQDRSPQGCVS
jgi:EAL domain-containing protein (putative c-di-GMP-specific phosphodiesterase class I)